MVVPQRARSADHVRAAPAAWTIDRRAGAGRGGTRYPMAATERLFARAVRPWQVPETNPSDGNERDPAHRRGDRLRQGGDQPYPWRSGPAGSTAATRPQP